MQWFSKKQSTVETSVFGTEFVAIKQGIDALRDLRYKLKMMGIPTLGPSHIYGDNMSIVYNTSRQESVLRKKSNLVCYHTVHESVSVSESLAVHIPSKKNVTDLMTKVLYGQKRRYLVSNILCDVHDNLILLRSECSQASLIPLIIVSNLRGLERFVNR